MEPWRERGVNIEAYMTYRLECVCGHVHLHVSIARMIMDPRKVWEKSQILHVKVFVLQMFKYSY